MTEENILAMFTFDRTDMGSIAKIVLETQTDNLFPNELVIRSESFKQKK